MELSIIIPNYYEERIKEIEKEVAFLYPKAEIIISNDLEGKGKGWAMREGFKHSIGKVIVFINGDMDIHPNQIEKLLSKLNEYDIVVGKKEIKTLPFRRKIITFISRFLIKWLFELPISDTQTGLKVFKREAISIWAMNGFAFDCEVLADAYSKGFKIGEVPIECISSKQKGIKTIIKTFWEAIIIRFKK